MLTSRSIEYQIINMFFTLLILVLLIFATPITIIFDGLIIQGLVAAVAAMSVAIVAVRIRPGEAGFLSTVIRPVAVVAAVPAIWMLIQVMPLQSAGLAHPIWKSAAAALGQPLAGSISIDPGATLISFVRYLSAIAIAFVAAAVAIDRRRAEWVLFALTAATTLVALMALAINFGIFTFLGPGDGGQSGAAATAIAGLGVIFATAAAFQTSERSKTRRPDQANSISRLTFAACLSALAICLLAVIVGATSQAYFAVICGIATLAIAVMIRRFNLGPWGIAAIISIALFVAIAVVAFQPSSRTVGFDACICNSGPGAADCGHAAYFGRNELGWKRSRHICRRPAHLSRHRRTDDRANCPDCCGRNSGGNGPTVFLGKSNGSDRTRSHTLARCIAAPKRFILFNGRSGLRCDYRVAVVR